MCEIPRVTVQFHDQDKSQLLTLLPALHVPLTHSWCFDHSSLHCRTLWLTVKKCTVLSDVVLIYSLQRWLDHTRAHVILCQVLSHILIEVHHCIHPQIKCLPYQRLSWMVLNGAEVLVRHARWWQKVIPGKYWCTLSNAAERPCEKS